ncbi:inaA protein [Methylophaga sp. SB9B]|uniref:lipopolysaccharide kinase InaA family protein n=1 Tax=Methylophaga sp. SB9B TaxID=2570356 RepID=UPI0010A901A1|nr:lipopolysaccharide kinase InaA family protein [Methylophaga sp. SB9B]THK41039.1 inaA protein [Methylophaga sp. SB9B]
MKKPASFVNNAFWSDDPVSKFDQLWALPHNWFDKPNKARGGWSGVTQNSMHSLQGDINVFIKRQQNYVSRTLLHPFSGVPTFEKELNNILLLKTIDIPTLEPIFFGKQADKAILVTKALDGYSSLDNIDPDSLSAPEKRSLLAKLARLTRKMHKLHYMHNCFYPKHIFVKLRDNGEWSIRLIDLEKLRWRFSAYFAMKRDLSTFNRHADKRWTIKDRLYFFKNYRQTNSLSARDKRLWLRLTNKSQGG